MRPNETDNAGIDATRRPGLICPRCGCEHWLVVYTRRRLGGTVLRRRECRHCGRRIVTIERTAGQVPPV